MTRLDVPIHKANGIWRLEKRTQVMRHPAAKIEYKECFFAIHESGHEVNLTRGFGWHKNMYLERKWLTLPIDQARDHAPPESMFVPDLGMPPRWSLEPRVVVTPVRPLLMKVMTMDSPRAIQNLPRTETTRKTVFIAHHERGFSLDLTKLGWLVGTEISAIWLEHQLPPRRTAVGARALRRNLQLVARGGT